MEFNKAIKIKELVNSWNKDRKDADYGYVKFKCEMYSIGKWSVELSAHVVVLFFSDEMKSLLKLYSEEEFSMIVNAFHNVPTIYMQ